MNAHFRWYLKYLFIFIYEGLYFLSVYFFHHVKYWICFRTSLFFSGYLKIHQFLWNQFNFVEAIIIVCVYFSSHCDEKSFAYCNHVKFENSFQTTFLFFLSLWTFKLMILNVSIGSCIIFIAEITFHETRYIHLDNLKNHTTITLWKNFVIQFYIFIHYIC